MLHDMKEDKKTIKEQNTLIRVLRERIDSLENEMNEENRRNTIMHENLVVDIKELEQKNNDYQSKVDLFQMNEEQFNSIICDLENKVNVLQCGPDDTRRAMAFKLIAQRLKIRSLESNITNLQSKFHEETEQLTEDLVLSVNQNKELQDNLTEKDVALDEVKKRNNNLLKENNILQEQLTSMELQSIQTKEKTQRLKDIIADLEDKIIDVECKVKNCAEFEDHSRLSIGSVCSVASVVEKEDELSQIEQGLEMIESITRENESLTFKLVCQNELMNKRMV
eukprot:UN22759